MMSAQRDRRAKRMALRHERLALGPVSDHQAEIAQAIQAFTAMGDKVTVPQYDEEDQADLSTQRLRRLRWMERRGQRLHLKPKSPDGDAIRQAIQLHLAQISESQCHKSLTNQHPVNDKNIPTTSASNHADPDDQWVMRKASKTSGIAYFTLAGHALLLSLCTS